MFMQLVRETFTDNATEGKLFINGTFECYTLEDTDRKLEQGGTKVQNHTCIPRGTYEVSTSLSTRFKRILPILADVPQFTGVRIHPGNSSRDTEGCILVGATNTYLADDFIGNSRKAFDALMLKIIYALESEDVTLEIV